MDAKRHIAWLYEQLPGLAQKGILSEEQVEKIKAHFGPADTKPAYNWAFITISIIGALLVGGGIILIFAYNWDELSRTWRTVLSIVPLLLGLAIYGYMLFQQRRSTAWIEGAASFLMLMLASSIALVSQTYHIMGTPEEFLLTWLVPSIALLYLAPSSLCAIIYYIGIASWATETRGSESVWYWALLLAGLPHLWWAWRRQEAIRYRLVAWALALTFPFGWFGAVEQPILLYGFWGSALVLGVMFLLEAFETAQQHANPVAQPFRTFAVVAVYIFLMVLTYLENYEPVQLDQLWKGHGYAAWAVWVNLIVWLAMLGGYVWLLLRRLLTGNIPAQGYFTALFPVFLLLILVFSPGLYNWVPQLAANIYLLAWGIAYLYTGIRYSRMGLVNLGMLIILSLIAFRFFDTEWSYLAKGIAFVGLGMAFLGTNYALSRRLKNT